MGCGCNKNSASNTDKMTASEAVSKTMQETKKAMSISDNEMVLIRYNHPNRGQHVVRGYATGAYYGYRGGGDSFLVHRDDIKKSPHIFVPVEQTTQTSEPSPRPVQEFDMESYLERIKKDWNEELDLQTLPGVTAIIEKGMKTSGFTTREAILRAGVDGLTDAVKGIGKTKAEVIVAYLENTEENE